MKINKKVIEELVEYLKEFNLSEIEYAEGATKVKVSRSINSSIVASESVIKKTPANRIGKPIEVALPVVFLLSDLSSYINGVNLPIDGGWTAW